MPALSPDLIYYCGQSLPWDPRSKDLGGSEQAVVELARHWVQAGLKVDVYGSIPEAMVCEGVTYRPVDQAPQALVGDVIVLWRMYGLVDLWKGLRQFQCRLLAVDFHDRELFGHEDLLFRGRQYTQALMYKSQFHADFMLGKLPPEKQAPLRKLVKVIPNGIRKQDFTLTNPPPREPHRFCYASCYLRGLVPLINFFWPAVRNAWPDAELHVYYGMENVRDPAARESISQALKAEGVYEHGRQPVSVICEEKHRSTFHLYYTQCTGETDCISIKESAYAGCIPIISGVNVFSERSGIVMPGAASTDQDYRQAAQAFITWAQQVSESELESIRHSLRNVPAHLDWQQTAQQWAQTLELVAPTISWASMLATYEQKLKGGAVVAAPPAAAEPAAKAEPWSIHSIQYINMAENVDRARWMQDQLQKSCPPDLIQRFDAVVGKTHVLTDEESALFSRNDFVGTPHLQSVIGNSLSHFKAWQEAAKLPDHAVTVILQDDAILISDFMSHLREVVRQMPDDAVALFISDHLHALFEKFIPVDLENQDLAERRRAMKQMVNDVIAKHVDTWAVHCSLGYVLTARGARQLVDYTRSHGFVRAVDQHLRDFLVLSDKNYCSIRCLATSSSENFDSDVWAHRVNQQAASRGPFSAGSLPTAVP